MLLMVVCSRVGLSSREKLYLKQSVDVEYCLYLYLCADLVLELVCGWYINQSVHNFVKNNQLQFPDLLILFHVTPNRDSQACP